MSPNNKIGAKSLNNLHLRVSEKGILEEIINENVEEVNSEEEKEKGQNEREEKEDEKEEGKRGSEDAGSEGETSKEEEGEEPHDDTFSDEEVRMPTKKEPTTPPSPKPDAPPSPHNPSPPPSPIPCTPPPTNTPNSRDLGFTEFANLSISADPLLNKLQLTQMETRLSAKLDTVEVQTEYVNEDDLTSNNIVHVKGSNKVRNGISLRMSNVDRRSTVPKFDDLTLLKNGDSTLFPDWYLEKLR
ncbi:uncharacterized protein LOC130810823 [Amaranthus tricolor]|uniref:uncharacterized protein LOC130810823 n=1 Tax=Amaranthus tricolor TaxID=29722 RepID=UPI00258C338A|nr:uncharacterized protein LOC130810823 [Amaranthus tricolor]